MMLEWQVATVLSRRVLYLRLRTLILALFKHFFCIPMAQTGGGGTMVLRIKYVFMNKAENGWGRFHTNTLF